MKEINEKLNFLVPLQIMIFGRNKCKTNAWQDGF